MQCNVCSSLVTDSVKCGSCNNHIGYCCSNISEQGYRKMNPDWRAAWKCLQCRDKSPTSSCSEQSKTSQALKQADLESIMAELREIQKHLLCLPALVRDVVELKTEIAKLRSFKAFMGESAFECKGMIAPVFTPFDEEGNVEYAVIPDYLAFLLHNGVKCILVGGTTGEATNLSVDERIGVFKGFMKVAKAMELKVILQVGGAPLVEVLRMAKCAEEMKADAIMTLPELYFKPKTTEQLVEYLKTVSNAAPSTPMIYYHFPMMTGVQVNVPEFFKMASRSFAFKGMKADLEVGLQVQTLLRKDQRIFIGNHMLGLAVFVGFDSSIATVTNLFPAVVKNLIEAAQAGDAAQTKFLQTKLNGLVAAITAQGDFVPAMKAAMPLVTGIKVGPPRQPLTAVTPEQTKELRASLKKLDFGRLK